MMHDMPEKRFHDPLSALRELERREAERASRDWYRAQAADRTPDGVNGGPFWYLIRVRHGAEWSTAVKLRRWGIMAWCPRRRAVEKLPRGNGKRRFRQVICPGYLFVQLAPFAGAVRGVMSFADEVRGFVGSGETPWRVRASDIKALRNEVAKWPAKKDGGDSLLSRGCLVLIKDGPFAGFDGPVTRPDDKHGRLEVEISIFARPTLCTFALDQVEQLR